MADRPRRSGLTQTFAVPDEDDIYDDPSIAPLEDAPGHTEETNASSLYNTNETITAFLNGSYSPTVESQLTTPPTPTPGLFIPTIATTPQFLKRKRQSSTPYRGVGQKDKALWKHLRARLPHEAEKDDHGHEIFYCTGDNCDWKGPLGNASRHLRKHAIFVGKYSATPSTIAQANSLQ
jgi:hypothetical protein